MLRTLFISDLHLSEQRPELTRAFFNFLEDTAQGAETLYILGDFFNIWIGDDDDLPLGFEVANALRMLGESGTQVFLMHGNRDFLLGKRFAKLSGAHIVDDPRITEIYGQRCVLLHGDSMCTLDADYMKLRSMFRDTTWQNFFLAKPIEERRAFAEQVRGESIQMSSNKADDITDVTPSEVTRLLAESGARLMIHGHTHRPAVHNEGQWNQRIVLGDWTDTGWYLELTPVGHELKSFVIR